MAIPHEIARACATVIRSGCAMLVLLVLSGGGIADTPEGSRWQPVVELWDEFEGRLLDPAKWSARNPYYSGKKPGLYHARNVIVDGGHLNLWARQESVASSPPGYHSYTAAYVSSLKPILYGYIEVRAKPMPARINSAFWLYRWTEQGTYEIDIFEVGGTVPGKMRTVHTNTHVYIGDPAKETDADRLSDPQQLVVEGAPLANSFHIYGLEWDEQELRFFFDGKLIRRKANKHWHQPMYIRFSAETHPDWFGLPHQGELPAQFQIDYLRVWRKIVGSDMRRLPGTTY